MLIQELKKLDLIWVIEEFLFHPHCVVPFPPQETPAPIAGATDLRL